MAERNSTHLHTLTDCLWYCSLFPPHWFSHGSSNTPTPSSFRPFHMHLPLPGILFTWPYIQINPSPSTFISHLKWHTALEKTSITTWHLSLSEMTYFFIFLLYAFPSLPTPLSCPTRIDLRKASMLPRIHCSISRNWSNAWHVPGAQ